jgi:hypothetical protein
LCPGIVIKKAIKNNGDEKSDYQVTGFSIPPGS